MIPSRVLKKLRSGKPAICTKTNLMDCRAIDIMGLIGFDCVWTCCEHIPNDWYTIENQIRTCKMHGMDCLVRVAKGSYSDYVRPLEADAAGIMVPHLMSAEEAHEVVRMTRFKPVGRRPVDGGNSDGQYCLIPAKEYFELANRERFVIVQIEDPEPLDQLDEICSVDGIDIVFFGPGDFSHSIGRPGEANHPEVLDARKRVAEACKRNGRFCGAPASVDNAQDLFEDGIQFLAIGADVIAIGQYYKDIHSGLDNKGLL